MTPKDIIWTVLLLIAIIGTIVGIIKNDVPLGLPMIMILLVIWKFVGEKK